MNEGICEMDEVMVCVCVFVCVCVLSWLRGWRGRREFSEMEGGEEDPERINEGGSVLEFLDD